MFVVFTIVNYVVQLFGDDWIVVLTAKGLSREIRRMGRVIKTFFAVSVGDTNRGTGEDDFAGGREYIYGAWVGDNGWPWNTNSLCFCCVKSHKMSF